MVGDVNVGGTATAVGAGFGRTCAALSSGHLRCWGQVFRRKNGESRTECIGDDELPTSVAALDLGHKVKSVHVNGSYNCALLETGSVRCWSMGWRMRMTYGASNLLQDDGGMIPMGDVDLGGKAVQLVTGAFHACALMETGRVRCWGTVNTTSWAMATKMISAMTRPPRTRAM